MNENLTIENSADVSAEEAEILPENAVTEEESVFEGTAEEAVEESSHESNVGNEARFEALLKYEQTVKEYKEFSELFPEATIDSLPDSVTNDVRAGVPLAAAYALYRYRREANEAKAVAANEKNKERSFAVKSNDAADSYFSPTEVREMSASEVQANYSKIIDSMSHWH